MNDRIRFVLNRINERLWVKPLAVCVLSIAGVLLARTADDTGLDRLVPDISADSIKTLLNVMASSMLVIATFAVASMVSAYASASTTATPRAFAVIVADDVSQNALSTFIGAFIFSIVGLIAVTNGYYQQAGRFTLFTLTLIVLATVIVTFVRWVDRIARLGRLGMTIDKVEKATKAALEKRRQAPTLRGIAVRCRQHEGHAVYGRAIGYVQRVDVQALQKHAAKVGICIEVAALPGTFSAPGRVLAYAHGDTDRRPDIDEEQICAAFVIGDGRTFDEDPRFGLVVLSEIAVRAMSPAVNDPGTAIDVIGTFVRLFALWVKPVDSSDRTVGECDRVEVAELSLADMFDDAFSAIAREGARTMEVAVRLQKALRSLAAVGDSRMRVVALHHARLAFARAERRLEFPPDLDMVRKVSEFATLDAPASEGP